VVHFGRHSVVQFRRHTLVQFRPSLDTPARGRRPERSRRTNPRGVQRTMAHGAHGAHGALKRAAPSPPSHRLAPFGASVGLLPHARPASAARDAPTAGDEPLDTGSGSGVPCRI
jgi:hypothetical protein